MTLRQSPLLLELDPRTGYIGNSWTLLDDASKEEVEAVIAEVENVLADFGMVTFVSMRNYPPGDREGVRARRLWIQLRKEMGRCHLFIFIYAGPSEGGAQELRNAATHRVPTIILIKPDVQRSELSWSPAPNYLTQLQYTSSAEAGACLRAYLRDNWQDVESRIARLVQLRRNATEGPSVGATIRTLREQRGWSRAELARRAGLIEDEVNAIEADFGAFAPTFFDLVSLASALGVNRADLMGPPEVLLQRNMNSLIDAIATTDGWSYADARDFIQNTRFETRVKNYELLTEDSLRREMRLWLVRNRRRSF